MKKIILVVVFLAVACIYGQDKYEIKNLEVNTKYSDFGVSYYGENIVFASSRREGNTTLRKWINKQPYLDLYKGTMSQTGEILNPEIFSRELNTKYHESNAAFTKDLKTVYFTRNNDGSRIIKDSLGWNNLSLFKADINNEGEWVNITPLPFNSDHYSSGHPSLSPDEKTLYYISDMPGTLGETDIFKVKINSDGSYGLPINMGNKINTPGKEMFPYVSERGNLYYSSDDRDGYGGLDVYVISLDSETAESVNLGTPINSSEDDFAFIINNINDRVAEGYFSSNRLGGRGDDDIYYFNKFSEPVIAECTQAISGKVRDKSTGALLMGTLVSLFKGEREVESILVESDASFNFLNLDCNTNYRLEAGKLNYTDAEENVATTDETGLELNVDIELDPEVTDVCQFDLDDVNPIYFGLDKYDILPHMHTELNKVVKILEECPGTVVNVYSHTDSRASREYNQKLSLRRAKSTVDYLEFSGISKDRIFSKGFGESKLLNKCSDNVKCSETEHKINRRSEFVIRKK